MKVWWRLWNSTEVKSKLLMTDSADSIFIHGVGEALRHGWAWPRRHTLVDGFFTMLVHVCPFDYLFISNTQEKSAPVGYKGASSTNHEDVLGWWTRPHATANHILLKTILICWLKSRHGNQPPWIDKIRIKARRLYDALQLSERIHSRGNIRDE